MNKVIVSGADGFLGRKLVKKLVEKNINVVAISPYFGESFIKSSLITKIESKISDSDGLLNLIPKDDYDVFFHFAWAGVNGSHKVDPSIQLENIKTTISCANASKVLGCRKLLCSGTIAEKAVESLPFLSNTNGGMIYGVAKHCAHLMIETYCKRINQPFVWMQFSNIYGPDNKTGNLISYTLGEIQQGHEATFGPAKQPYDFIYVDDLIEAVYRLGFSETHKNQYVISSGGTRILYEFLNEIGEIYGRPDLIKIGVRPDDGIIYTESMFDNTSLREDIGNYVSTSFSDGIRLTISKY